jgi:ribose-phosphate pyrophosphokinase
MLVLGFEDYASQTTRLATALGVPRAMVAIHRFPDGESKLVLPTPLPERVIVCRSLDRPNDKLIELMLCARTARELGARQLTLVAPYLCYMRQDVAFAPGETVSQRIVGEFLAGLFDAVVSVDPHLHRVATLKEAVPAQQAIAATAADVIGAFLLEQLRDALLVGPDVESEQWVATAARRAGWEYVCARKERRGDQEVRVTLPPARYGGRDAVIVDDMASTGHTIAETARALHAQGARAIHAAVTHGLFNAGALGIMKEAGVDTLWYTDSVGSAEAGIPLAPLLAETVRKLPY